MENNQVLFVLFSSKVNKMVTDEQHMRSPLFSVIGTRPDNPSCLQVNNFIRFYKISKMFMYQRADMKRIISRALMGIVGLLIYFTASTALATEVFIPRMEATPGQQVQIPVKVDLVENLAGVKLVITYDSDILSFKKAEKTNETSSLMHIVNDKTPGRLILVMAGPTGIKGEGVTLMLLTFDVNKNLRGVKKTQLAITEAQMKNDQLKDVAHTIRVDPLVFLF
jgi:hypothetical protein